MISGTQLGGDTFVRRDQFMLLAVNELSRQHGLEADEFTKGKTLRKFGRTTNADAGIKTTVATFQGAVVNETFATGNTVDYIVSDSASDTGTVVVEGHILVGTSMVSSTQQVTLTGTTPVALVPLFRANRIAIPDGTIASPSVDLVGNVYVYDSTLAGGVTAGTPNTATATKVMVAAGNNQSAKCATSISGSDVLIITSVYAAVQRGNGSISADVDLETRKLGGVWKPLGLEASLRSNSQSSMDLPQRPYAIIMPDTDVRMVATTDGANGQVSGHFHGVFASV